MSESSERGCTTGCKRNGNSEINCQVKSAGNKDKCDISNESNFHAGHTKIKVWRGPTKGDPAHRVASFGYWFHHDGHEAAAAPAYAASSIKTNAQRIK